MTTTETKPTKSQEAAKDVQSYLRARTPLLWIITPEEARAERYIMEAAAAASYVPHAWDCGQGVTDLAGKPEAIGSADIGETLGAIAQRAAETLESRKTRDLWILRDAPAWFQGPAGMVTCRQMRNLARSLPATDRKSAQALVVLTPSSDIPPELKGHATVINWPLPDRTEVAAILDAAIKGLPDDMQETAAPNGTRDAAIDAAVGLSHLEAQACYSKSIVQTRRIDPAIVAKEKKRLIATSGVLEWFDPLPNGLESVGGLENLKSYLYSRKDAFTPEARAYGLPTPVGAFIAGWNGCGKSLLVKAIATVWQNPLIRVDLGAAKSKFVGDSEQTLRRTFETVTAIGRCVLWFDEVEKMFAGSVDGSADGGVAKDQLGFLLTWMQEKRGEAFLVATSNDATVLPPELMRRFDSTWFVDLPNVTERGEIVAAALREHGRGSVAIDLPAVAAVTEGYSGAELAALVPAALYAGFGDGRREIRTQDLIDATRGRIPGSRTNAEKLAKMRAWAEGRALPASAKAAQEQASNSGPQLDI